MRISSARTANRISGRRGSGDVRRRKAQKCINWAIRNTLFFLILLVIAWIVFVVANHEPDLVDPNNKSIRGNTSEGSGLSRGLQQVRDRARAKQSVCTKLMSPEEFNGFDTRYEVPFYNATVATLPSFGIINALEKWEKLKQPEQCVLPPSKECAETQFTVVFMAYNPDRLGKTLAQIVSMLNPGEFKDLVKEVILVWNGERSIDESKDGQRLLEYAQTNALRVVYPLKMGLPNDLMNRYHPEVVKVTTAAIMYYDDDGPFYSVQATEAGFEWWKRHADAQLGAMAREISYGPRQVAERAQVFPQLTDTEFVSHCSNVNDKVDYNFRYFANYDANMVLPSGSFLHSDYLCWLWHPALHEIRQFVLDHPVHPDDMTVSMIVSQLAGKAPTVYSRRLNPPSPSDQKRRRLMDGINWDAGAGMNDQKQRWADLRTEAVNSLVGYFGSLNSGSIGWCEGTEYFNARVDGKCDPLMAKQGMLPWMSADGLPITTCA